MSDTFPTGNQPGGVSAPNLANDVSFSSSPINGEASSVPICTTSDNGGNLIEQNNSTVNNQQTIPRSYIKILKKNIPFLKKTKRLFSML
jgi:hypothetical protein